MFILEFILWIIFTYVVYATMTNSDSINWEAKNAKYMYIFMAVSFVVLGFWNYFIIPILTILVVWYFSSEEG